MDFSKIESAAFYSLKQSIRECPRPKGDEFTAILSKAIREAIEAYDKARQE